MNKELKPLTKQQVSNKMLGKAYSLVDRVDENLLDLSITLWELQENNLYDVKEFWETSGLGKRKTYYLIDIGRAFYNLPVTQDQAKAIGWTKLKIIAPYVTAENWKDLLDLAENHKSTDLEKIMRGEHVTNDERVVVFRLPIGEKARLEKMLLKYGAFKVKHGIADKDQALMNVVSHLGF